MPAHWEVRRLRNVAEMRVSNVDKLTKNDERPVRLCNYTDVYKNDRIRAEMPFMRATATTDEIERFRLRVGDVLITKDSEAWDDIGVPSLVSVAAPDLISGYHLALLRPRDYELLGGYLLRALQSKNLAYQFHIEAKGVTRFGLTHSGIKSVWLPVPPLPEQAAIVRFLDHADRLIRRYVRAKEKLIALLEEQKQVVIHQAVTGRIDVRTGQPYPAYKPSGVEWLGDVPTHWQVKKLTQIARQETGHTPSRKVAAYWKPEDCTIPWLSLSDVWQLRIGKVYIYATKEKVSEIGLANSAARLLPKGTVVLSRTASVGFPLSSESQWLRHRTSARGFAERNFVLNFYTSYSAQ